MKTEINNIHVLQYNSAWNIVNVVKVLFISIIIILGRYSRSLKWLWNFCFVFKKWLQLFLVDLF